MPRTKAGTTHITNQETRNSDMTSNDFAKLIGVSQSTVSRALNEKDNISQATKEYVLAKAKEYGFILNSQASSLKTQRSNSIGILFPSYFQALSSNLMFTYLYDTLQAELIKSNYDVLVISELESREKSSALERIVKSHKIDGLINFKPDLSDKEISLIKSSGIPYISLHSGLQNSNEFHQLILDDYYAGEQVGNYFANFDSLPVYIGPLGRSGDKEKRLSGFVDALAKKSTAPYCLPLRDVTMKEAYNLVLNNRNLFSDHKTSIFAYNDVIARGIIAALNAIGVCVPDQTQIIGMDDIPIATWLPPALSTMACPVRQMTGDACQLMIRLINGEDLTPATVFYKSSLIIRDTSLPL